jgi:hypothetical protein
MLSLGVPVSARDSGHAGSNAHDQYVGAQHQFVEKIAGVKAQPLLKAKASSIFLEKRNSFRGGESNISG